MCKGSGSRTVNQNQTYQPDPNARAAIESAIGLGAGALQPFHTPVAPVAGFSPQQQQAFDITGQAQGMALPYLNTAANYFTPQGAQQFFNPMAQGVMANMQDIFGQQRAQMTGNLTQQAGGVGADRIAVGQAELAKQQGLAGGQTLSDLYSRAQQVAQGAGFGMGSLGPAAQGSVLQGAQALLGTGGLQQQLAQAQQNAPYQNILQSIMWPYQNAQFFGNLVGGLAPGLGGTTAGQTVYPQQSPLGSILGAGLAGLGGYGMAGGFGRGKGAGGGGYNWDNPPPAGVDADTDPSLIGNTGGRVPYADGGEVDDDSIRNAEISELRADANPHGMMGRLPSGVSGAPISTGPQFPTGQVTAIQPHIPQLPQVQGGGGGGGGGKGSGSGINIGDIAKIAGMAMAFMNRGGAVPGYASGGGLGTLMPPTMSDPTQTVLTGGGLGSAPPLPVPPQQLTGGGAFGADPAANLGAPSPALPPQQLTGGAPSGGPIPASTAPLPIGGNMDPASATATTPALATMGGGHHHHAGGFDPRMLWSRFGQAFGNKGSFMGGGNPMMGGGSGGAPMSGTMGRPSAMPWWAGFGGAGGDTGGTMQPQRLGGIGGYGFAEGGGVDDESYEAPPFLQSGLESAPPASAPLSRGLPDYEQRDPNELAMMRMRNSARPIAGRAGEGPTVRNILSMTGPGRALDLLEAGTGAAAEMFGSRAHAAEKPDPRQAEIDRLQTRIDDNLKQIKNNTTQITTLGTTKTPSPKGTQDKAINELTAANERMRVDNEQWQARLGELRSGVESDAAAKAKREQSWQEAYPGVFAAAGLGAPVASYFTGKLPGKKIGSTLGAIGVGGLGGAAEGAGAAFAPTYLDLKLPEGSPAKEAAMKRVRDPLYWLTEVAPIAGGSALAGGYGSYRTALKQRPNIGPQNLPPPRGPGGGSPGLPMPPAPTSLPGLSPGPSAPPALPAPKVIWDKKNQVWRQQGTGRWASPKGRTPPEEARGGAVFARGGSASNPYFADGGGDTFGDRFSEWDTQDNPLPVGGSGAAVPKGFDGSGSAASYDEVSPKRVRTIAYRQPEPEDSISQPRQQQAALDGEVLPPERSAPASGGMGGGSSGGKGSGMMNSPWMALLAAGLGTMAASGQRDSRGLPTSPLSAIGQGGMQGIQTLKTQQDQWLKQQGIDRQVAALNQQLRLQQQRMAQAERLHNTMTPYQKGSLDLQQQRYSSGLFDPETVNMLAEQALVGDKSVFSQLSRGLAGPQNIVQVRNRMNELMRQRGWTGSDVAAKNAEFVAESKAAGSAAVREANVASAIEEAKNTFPLALKASDALPREKFVPWNQLQQLVRQKTSSPEQARFAVAVQGAVTAYSQAMSRTGVNTVHAQQHAELLLDKATDHEAFKAAIDQMGLEMEAARAAPEAVRKRILSHISGREEGTPPPAAPAKGEAPPGFTGRTATNPNTGKKLRETSDGNWVE